VKEEEEEVEENNVRKEESVIERLTANSALDKKKSKDVEDTESKAIVRQHDRHCRLDRDSPLQEGVAVVLPVTDDLIASCEE